MESISQKNNSLVRFLKIIFLIFVRLVGYLLYLNIRR